MSDVTDALLSKLSELHDHLLSDDISDDDALEMLFPYGKDKYGRYLVTHASLTDNVRPFTSGKTKLCHPSLHLFLGRHEAYCHLQAWWAHHVLVQEQ